jgi:molybdopterin converting factor small subunit
MINVDVRYYNILIALSGARGEQVELPEGALAQDLVAALAARHPGAFHDFVFDAVGGINPHLRLFLNDRPLDLADPLTAGDRVLLFPAVAGG